MTSKLIFAVLGVAALAAGAAPSQVTYCPCSSSSCGSEFISNVSLNTLNHTSSCGSGAGYEDFSGFSSTLTPGVPATIGVTVTQWYPSDRVNVYIDWNGNGVFTDPGETYMLTPTSAGTFYGTVKFEGAITPPTNAVLQTRMRVRLIFAYGLTPAGMSPCGTFTYGEAEDYTINVGPPLPAWYQQNSGGAGLSLDGVAGSDYSVATVATLADNVCSHGTATVTMSSTFQGYPWDVGITASPAVPGGGAGFYTFNNIVNLNLSDPSLVFIHGLAGNVPFTNASFPVSPGAPLGCTVQMIVFDGGASIDGFRLSQPTRLTVTYAQPGAPPAGPTGSLGFATYTLGGPGLTCTGGSFPFYGVNYTQVMVSSTGRLVFGGNANYYPFPSPAQPPGVAGPGLAMGTWTPAMIGVWSDFDLSVGGAVTVTTPAPGIFRADWVGVQSYAGYPLSSFRIQLDTTTGFATLDLLGGVAQAAPASARFVGISPGAAGTDPGPVGYPAKVGLGLQPGPGGSGMIYNIGANGAGLAGVTRIVFMPNGTGNYNYTVF